VDLWSCHPKESSLPRLARLYSDRISIGPSPFRTFDSRKKKPRLQIYAEAGRGKGTVGLIIILRVTRTSGKRSSERTSGAFSVAIRDRNDTNKPNPERSVRHTPIAATRRTPRPCPPRCPFPHRIPVQEHETLLNAISQIM
jgi:hypothetical protein